MPVSTSLLVYIGVVVVLWIAYLVRKRWRAGSKPRFGDADAYDGNLIIPPPGELHGTATGGHSASHVGHAGHVGHTHGPAGGHAGHGPTAGHH